MLSQGVEDFRIGGKLQFNCYFETPPPSTLRLDYGAWITRGED